MRKAESKGFMRQFAKARREVEELRKLYPHACRWATLTWPRAIAQTSSEETK